MSLALFFTIIIVIKSHVQSQTTSACWSVLKYFLTSQLGCNSTAHEGYLHSFMFETLVLEEMVRLLGTILTVDPVLVQLFSSGLPRPIPTKGYNIIIVIYKDS